MNRSRHFRAPALALLAGAALLLGACGGGGDDAGGQDIPGVETCLKKLDLTVERFDASSKQATATSTKSVKEGVTAVSKKDAELTIALAAVVTTKARVKQFEQENTSLKTQLSEQQQREYSFSSGSDGRYVWSVAGSKQSKQLNAARNCVKP